MKLVTVSIGQIFDGEHYHRGTGSILFDKDHPQCGIILTNKHIIDYLVHKDKLDRISVLVNKSLEGLIKVDPLNQYVIITSESIDLSIILVKIDAEIMKKFKDRMIYINQYEEQDLEVDYEITMNNQYNNIGR